MEGGGAALEVVELNVLNTARAGDFAVHHVVGMGQSGLVVAARCTMRGLPDPSKLYAVKLLLNFTHEYSSIVRNSFENEWLILSRLLPHDNIVRFWAQFISTIPDAFAEVLPEEVRKLTKTKSRSGAETRKKGQFLVLDYHPQDLRSWAEKLSYPLSYEITLKFTEQLLGAAHYLEKAFIRHLDLKPTNILVAEDNRIIVCDFGSAVQFTDDNFILKFIRGILPGGNKAHLAPEVLNTYHRCRVDPKRERSLDYIVQASFAIGVLIHEIATGEHPLSEYPLAYTNSDGHVQYEVQDLSTLPECYPKGFCSIVLDLLQPVPARRLPLAEAANQLRVCCLRKSSSASPSSLSGTERVKQERDLAKAKLSVVASERDYAVTEMRRMAEECQNISAEFDRMASHSDQLLQELEQVRHERDSALKASESAYEACEMLREQVTLMTRERDMAQAKVEELRGLTQRRYQDDGISECSRCQRFFVEAENSAVACYWHPGRVSCTKLSTTGVAAIIVVIILILLQSLLALGSPTPINSIW